MATEIVRADRAEHKQSLLAVMAAQYQMDPAAFHAVITKTVMPSSATNEQVAAYLMVCREYRLNPLLRQVYAFPARNGGIVPMVGIDGWYSIINDHPQFDGIEFQEHFDSDGQIAACTCTIYRKDRSHPTKVTEFYAECSRQTDPWKGMPRRQLRHKAAIQCARIAFALGGIYDEDEARDMVTADGQQTVVLPPKPGASKTENLKADLAARKKREDTPAPAPEPPSGEQLFGAAGSTKGHVDLG